MSVNKAVLLGNLGVDPKSYKMKNGQEVTNFSLATSKSYKDKDGQKKETTEWHRIVAFGHLASFASEHLSKGDKVFLEGELQTRKFKDKDEQEREATQIKVDSLTAIKVKKWNNRHNQNPGIDNRESQNDFNLDVNDVPF